MSQQIWLEKLHHTTQRNDLKNLITNATTSDGSETVEDGLEDIENEVTKLRWPNDRRLSDVRKLLQSAKPVIIGVQQRPEVSDHDFVEEQERNLRFINNKEGFRGFINMKLNKKNKEGLSHKKDTFIIVKGNLENRIIHGDNKNFIIPG